MNDNDRINGGHGTVQENPEVHKSSMVHNDIEANIFRANFHDINFKYFNEL